MHGLNQRQVGQDNIIPSYPMHELSQRRQVRTVIPSNAMLRLTRRNACQVNYTFLPQERTEARTGRSGQLYLHTPCMNR